MTLAKNLSAGYIPIAAVVVNDHLYKVISEHSSRLGTFAMGMTYSGHPAACAAALACINIYNQPGFLESIKQKGDYLNRLLLAHPAIAKMTNVRSIGLLSALTVPPEYGTSAKDLALAALKERIDHKECCGEYSVLPSLYYGSRVHRRDGRTLRQPFVTEDLLMISFNKTKRQNELFEHFA